MMDQETANQYCSDTSTKELIFGAVTDRAGILALANMPILWVFAGRNDIFLWLTGWSFATYNSFHRWVARIVIVQVIIHSIGYTWLYLQCELECISLSGAD